MAKNGRGDAGPMMIRSILLTNKARLQPDTLQRLMDAENGAVVALEPGEFDAFKMIHFHVPTLDRMVKEPAKKLAAENAERALQAEADLERT